VRPRPAASHKSVALYVGDLSPEVTENDLFAAFNAVAAVTTIRVCRSAVTRESLGYAYVNFHSAADADKAMAELNYTTIKGRPCRIAWSQRDPSTRRSNVGNLFVKNLGPEISTKEVRRRPPSRDRETPPPTKSTTPAPPRPAAAVRHLPHLRQHPVVQGGGGRAQREQGLRLRSL